jgi:RecA-family ATPase
MDETNQTHEKETPPQWPGKSQDEIMAGRMTPAVLFAESQKLKKELTEGKSTDLLLVETANDCMAASKLKTVPKMLFAEFWGEDELCILFAESGSGKSILAVQIGDSISSGKQISNFTLEAAAQPVLYYDFELNEKMFEKRYSVDYTNHYPFANNFYRVSLNPNAVLPEGVDFESHLHVSIERSIIRTGAKILIIDNLTYLSSETEKARDAMPLMKLLKTLKNKYGLSILTLAHTPKRTLSNAITRNDLQGSKMLYNFCDSAFAIGESATDKGIRYLKQIKPRNTELIYDAENICTCQLNKPENFLRFEFLGFSTEKEHLRQFSEKDKADLIAQVKDLNKKGMSQREIAVDLGISIGAVNKYLKK